VAVVEAVKVEIAPSAVDWLAGRRRGCFSAGRQMRFALRSGAAGEVLGQPGESIRMQRACRF